MATPVTHFDTGHSDTVHDSQFDYYGQRLATCSSDGIVRIFAVGQEAQYLADLTGHSGPVWQVTWGHPKFGNILASASFDHTVIVWKEHQDGSWYILHRTDVNLHTGSHLRHTLLRTVCSMRMLSMGTGLLLCDASQQCRWLPMAALRRVHE